jgi:hypothetical protein
MKPMTTGGLSYAVVVRSARGTQLRASKSGMVERRKMMGASNPAAQEEGVLKMG